MISVGDKVVLKMDGEIYIVEEEYGIELAIRKYYQEETKQIEVRSNDVVILPPNWRYQNEENSDDDDSAIESDSAIEIEIEIESMSQFSDFRKKFFKVSNEIPYNPFYFCLVPNMTVFMMWTSLLSLLVMSLLTFLFCLCPLVFPSPAWCFGSQLVLSLFGVVLPQCIGFSNKMKPQVMFFIVSFNVAVFAVLYMALKPEKISSWSIFLVLTMGSRCLLQPVFEVVINYLLEDNTDFLIAVSRTVLFTMLLNTAQLTMLPFWVWAPQKLLHVLGHNELSFLIIVLLLKLSKHGFLHIHYAVSSWTSSGSFYVTQLRCLSLGIFSEVFVLSTLTLDDFAIMFCFRLLFDLFENIKHVQNFRDPVLKIFGYEYTPQAIGGLINHKSSYVCATETFTVIIPLYFCIAMLIFIQSGQIHHVWFWNLHSMDTFPSSFILSMLLLIIPAIFNISIMRKVLSRLNICMAHDRIYLMENYFALLFVTPLVFVGYFLMSCLIFGHVVSQLKLMNISDFE